MTLHMMSDGPVTQYRNKKNVHLLNTLTYIYIFKQITENFCLNFCLKRLTGKRGHHVQTNTFNRGEDVQTPKELFQTTGDEWIKH